MKNELILHNPSYYIARISVKIAGAPGCLKVIWPLKFYELLFEQI